tara:strand:+ start:55 stop:453 length:399 start_codon:yes stop_codon:yes gene_type:complete
MIAEMLTCIALNVYYEARSEPLEGQYAVAHVVLNRVADDKFPNDACKVVKQGLEKGIGRCQFSWYCDGKSDTPKEQRAWLNSQLVAHKVVHGYVKDNTDGSVYYHANYVKPFWSKHYRHTVTLGSHIFYKGD